MFLQTTLWARGGPRVRRRQQRRLCRWLRNKTRNMTSQAGPGRGRGAYCGTRAKPRQPSGGEAIRRDCNSEGKTQNGHPSVVWEAYDQVVFTGTCELSFIRHLEWLWLAYLPSGTGVGFGDGFGAVVCSFRVHVHVFVMCCWQRLALMLVIDLAATRDMAQTAPRTKVPRRRASIRA